MVADVAGTCALLNILTGNCLFGEAVVANLCSAIRFPAIRFLAIRYTRFPANRFLSYVICPAPASATKNLFMRKLYPVLFFFLPLPVAAQGYYGLKTFYETINAKTVSKRWGDLDFKGKVRSVKEIIYKPVVTDEKDIDTLTVTRYHFTENGLLDSLLKGDTAKGLNFSKAYYEVYDFDKKNGKLKSCTLYNGNYYAHVIKKKFNAEGFVTSERFDAYYMDNADQLCYTAYYTYRNNFSELAIRYRYDLSETHYDRRDDGTWKFTFNNAGLLTAETHQEEDFGSSMTIHYDPKWKLPASIFYTEQCATENSCLRMVKGITYDEQGRKIREGLSDATIRNSTWSYDYCYGYAYDANGTLIKKTDCQLRNQTPLFTPGKNIKAKKNAATQEPPNAYTAFEYVYDALGNWVERKEYAVNGSNKTLVNRAEREIAYY